MERNFKHRPEFALKTARQAKISNMNNQTVQRHLQVSSPENHPGYSVKKAAEITLTESGVIM